MTYHRQNDRVTIEMDIHQFNWLLIILGFAAGGSPQNGVNAELFHSFLAFLNEPNGNQKYETAELQ